MAGTTVAETINNFIRGIELRDLKLVEESLDSYVSPDTPVSGFHPLFYLLATNYGQSSRDIQEAVTEKQYEENTTKLIDLLFQHGAKVTETEKYETKEYRLLMDRLLLSDHFVDASTVLLHAIRETAQQSGEVYQPDIRKTISNAISTASQQGEVDVRGSVSNILNVLERLHNIVRQRLANPQTELEREVAEKYADAAKPYREGFVRPTVDAVVKDLAADDAEVERTRRHFAKKSGSKLEKYITVLEKKDPMQVLQELDIELANYETQKKQMRSLAFSRQFSDALAEKGVGNASDRKYGEVIMGPEGIGKSTLAYKKAELLVALGITGPNLVEFTKDNAAAASENLTPDALTRIFSKADVISIELAEINYNPRNPLSDFSLRMISSLKASLEGRKDKPPVVFISGLPAIVEEILEANPSLEGFVPNFSRYSPMDETQLGNVLDNKLARKGFTIDDDARKLILKAADEAHRELGKDFKNAESIMRVVDALPDRMGERLFGPGSKGSPNKTELTTVVVQDVEGLDLFSLLAGPALAKRQPAGFTSKLRYTN